jgi:intraflagellar transport protein 140
MAANYLQTREWRTSPELMKGIITFYKKARAMESLARFYESCAQVEIDEYHNFEKALGALKEAMLFLQRSKGPDKQRLVGLLEAKMALIEQFLQARKLFKASQEEQAIAVCQGLVNATAEAPDPIVRVGNVYALLVEYFHAKGDLQQVHALIE